MENLHESPAVCKPKITALAQLVALYAECRGVTSTAELVAATGYTERAIRKAKAELWCRNQGAAGTRVPEPQCRHRNQGAVSEPQCRNQGADSASRTHANTELPSEVLDTKKAKNPLNPQTDERVAIVDGRLVVCDDLRKFWIAELDGDEKRLDLALIEIGDSLQTNSRRPLESQLGSRLARIAAEKRDRDNRYKSVAASNAAAPKAQAKTASGGRFTATQMRAMLGEAAL